MSEVNTLISDCQEEADPDQCSTVDIGQAVFSPGLAEVGNQWPEQEAQKVIFWLLDGRDVTKNKRHSEGFSIKI